LDSKDVPNLKTEHQHLVCVNNESELVTNLRISNCFNMDRTVEAEGYSIDGLLEKAIWQN